MRRVVVLALLAAAACGKKPAPQEPAQPPAGSPAPSAASPVNEGAPTTQVETNGVGPLADNGDPADNLPGEIYKRAIEQARHEITIDNAAERLRALEREIELDRQNEH